MLESNSRLAIMKLELMAGFIGEERPVSSMQ